MAKIDEQQRSQSFGDVLQKYRARYKISQAELAEKFNTSRNTINNWENNRSKPDYESIRQLVQLFGIPLYELFQLSDETYLSSREFAHLSRYRQLTDAGRRVTDDVIASLLKEEERASAQPTDDEYIILPLEATPAAAGTGCMEIEEAPEPFFVRNTPLGRRADALIRVSGHSMEPRYQDQDLVYVKFTAAADEGDDVVCYYTGGAIIKHVQDNRLRSLNVDYPFSDKSEDDHVRIMGRVLGIVDRNELPDDEKRCELEILMADELRDFEEKYSR